MGFFVVYNSYKEFKFTHFQLFSHFLIYFTCNSTNKTTINIFIFINICSTSTTISTGTSILLFFFIHIRNINTLISIDTNTKTITIIFVFTFIFICTCNISIITSNSNSTLTITLGIKLTFTVFCFSKLYIMICLSIFYLFLISSIGFVMKILKHLNIALSTILWKRVKIIFFEAMFNQSIVDQFKIFQFGHKFNHLTILYITKLHISFQLY